MPREIADLTNLTLLNLSSNQLTSLPPEIATLTKLTTLNLSFNQLVSLPPEITKLTNLTSLNLSFNRLRRLRPRISKLSNLTKLDLSYNQLLSLPAEIIKLINLTSLDLRGNRLPVSPETLANHHDVRAIFVALAGLEKRKRLNEAKLLPVEVGDLGKSSERNNPTRVRIFISYAREDVRHAKELYQRLRRHGFTPWMDKVNLLAGQQWQPAIEKAIKSADFFLLLMSRHSIEKRGFVQREIRAALDFWREKLSDDIYLIPVMLEAIPFPEVPDELRKFHWVEFYEADGWQQLVKAMEFQAARRGLGFSPLRRW